MDKNTPFNLDEYYKLETRVAKRLRNSTADERTDLYRWAYDEIFKTPNHPLLVEHSKEEIEARVAKDIRNMEVFLNADSAYLEIGSGDCEVAAAVSKRVKKVYALDVSMEIARSFSELPNFELVLSDGISIPVPANSVDIAYSNQLMEHLHPDDALRQLGNIFKALKVGGAYFCITPNRLSGPHDVSRTFDDVATGLHLKEYTVTEMDEILTKTGFSKIKVYLRYSEFGVFIPIFLFRTVETFVGLFPHKLRKLLTFNKVVRFILGVKIVGWK